MDDGIFIHHTILFIIWYNKYFCVHCRIFPIRFVNELYPLLSAIARAADHSPHWNRVFLLILAIKCYNLDSSSTHPSPIQNQKILFDFFVVRPFFPDDALWLNKSRMRADFSFSSWVILLPLSETSWKTIIIRTII